MNSTKELIEKARNLKNEEKFKEAIKICKQLINKESLTSDFRKFYIEVLFAYGHHLNDEYIEEYEKAVKIFDRIIELDPNNYKAFYNKGIAYFNMDEMQKALEWYFKALKIKPDYMVAYYNIGLAYETIGELYSAKEYYNKALKIDPNFIYAVHAKADVKQKLNSLQIQNPKLKSDIEQLRSLLKVSKRIRIQMIQELLNIGSDKLDVIINWCNKYKFEIDGDFLEINKETLPELLESLDNDIIF